MTSHIVLMKPRPDLSSADRLALVKAFEHAIREVPTVRGVRIGRRILHDAGYEHLAPDSADYLIAIDFDDLDGLKAYLQHPAHETLAVRFNQSISSAFVYDFDVGGVETLTTLA
jgi:Stress responsive A/B Barrel Domain